MAAVHGLDHFDDGYAVTGDDLEAATAGQGVPVEPGDALLVRTGHMHFLRAGDKSGRQPLARPVHSLGRVAPRPRRGRRRHRHAGVRGVAPRGPGRAASVHLLHLVDMGMPRDSCGRSTTWPATARPRRPGTTSCCAPPRCPLTGAVGGPVAPHGREMSAVVPPETVAWELQLPIQAQSTIFVEPGRRTPWSLVAVVDADRAGVVRRGVRARRHPPTAGRDDGRHLVRPDRHARPWPGSPRQAAAPATSWPCRTTTPWQWPRPSPPSTGCRAAAPRILGVGAGHVEGEFALLGLDFAARGRHVEAALPAIRAALDHEYPALPDGGSTAPRRWRPARCRRRYRSGSAGPRPWPCGGRPGWATAGCPRIRPRDLPGVVERIRRLRAEAGQPERFDVRANVGCYVGTPTWDVGRTYLGEPAALADMLRPWVEAGANQLQVRFGPGPGELVDQIERFGADVAPNL